MFLFDFFRSFLPLHNPLGFGAADYIELALAILLVLLVFARRRIEPYAARLAHRTAWCMLLAGLLPVALRLALLPLFPVPTPYTADDFSYLLLADTLRHFRLANATHPLHQFFETVFVLQEPAYSSIFPIGQGITLAVGRMLFGHPWAGVVLSVAGFCALCYWMLRAWTTPLWALAGGLLAVIEFGPLNQWMNTYWGGAVSAMSGCLVFGALPRLRTSGRTRDAVLLGTGLAIQLLTRPFEFVLLLISVSLYFLFKPRISARAVLFILLTILPAGALTLLHDKAVTGSWTTLPYMLSRYQYGVPATFTVQPNPVPHRQLTAEQQLDYDAQTATHGRGADTFASYLLRLGYRVRFYRFFFLAPLYVALPAFLLSLREPRFIWVAISVLVFSLGANLYPYFYPHYIAAVTCLFILISVTALERLSRPIALLILMLCAAHFLFWYGLHVSGGSNLFLDMVRYETWDYINYGDPEGRIAINNRLAQLPGKQLVFVRYWPQHRFQEWIHNDADIDRARVVRALDLGPAENEKLRNYYRGRTAWLLEPDARPPKLIPYAP